MSSHSGYSEELSKLEGVVGAESEDPESVDETESGESEREESESSPKSPDGTDPYGFINPWGGTAEADATEREAAVGRLEEMDGVYS